MKGLKWPVLLVAASLTAFSCSSEKEKSEIAPEEQNIIIRAVKYVNDDQVSTINSDGSSESSDKLTASTRNAYSTVNTSFGSTEGNKLDIRNGAEFDYTVDFEASRSGLKASINASGSLKAADVAMDSNKKFRLVFMQEGNSTPIYNAELNSGQNPNLKVAANKKYNWYAFSINGSGSVPNIDGSGNIAASALSNKDFMFASGSFTAQKNENYLDILFIRQMAAIDLTLNTRGIFGGITDNSTFSIGTGTSSSFNNLIKTGIFNIFNASFSNLEDAAALKGSEMTPVDSRWGNAEKKGRFYTANTSATVSANNLRVRLNSLNITLDDNNTRTFAANTVVPISHSSTLSFTKGTLSKTNVRLIESGVTVGGLVWARTNLIYESSKLYGSSYNQGSSDAYRFRPNNNYAYPNVNKEYWNFGASTPTGTDYQKVDECRRVYPEGTWRLPNEQDNGEMTALSQNTNRSTSVTSVADGYRHSMIWKGTQAVNSAYPDNDLILSAYGFRNSNGSVQSIPSASSTGNGLLIYRSNQYFQSNSTTSILYCTDSSGSFGSTSIQRRAYSEGDPIRCVRNVVNN
ncbi:MAG: hypothetical protein LBJ04_16205 [Sphingobacterium sp.]|nr:hypothetical protein [Sphingobacterium sp.]